MDSQQKFLLILEAVAWGGVLAFLMWLVYKQGKHPRK